MIPDVSSVESVEERCLEMAGGVGQLLAGPKGPPIDPGDLLKRKMFYKLSEYDFVTPIIIQVPKFLLADI